MAIRIFSDKPVEDWAAFAMETVQLLEERKVRGMAIVALLDQDGENNDQAILGYHNMGLSDKEEAVMLIHADVVKAIVKANLQDWLDELE